MSPRVFSLAKNQQGCRFLQHQLDEDSSPENLARMLADMWPFIAELMIDPFGNYLCQKIIEKETDEQRLRMLVHVAPSLVPISKNSFGSRCIQKLVEHATLAQQASAVGRAFSGSVVSLVNDLNANHVIQRCLHCFQPPETQFIYDEVCASLSDVATQRHGCCVLQRCFEYANENQKNQLINAISDNALALVESSFGNYVVQYALSSDCPACDALMRKFLPHFSTLCMQKFSSNVMEKCLIISAEGLRNEFVESMLTSGRLGELVLDPYGNYVVQKALVVCSPLQLARFSELIRPMMPQLRNTPFGKRIQSKLFKDQGLSA